MVEPFLPAFYYYLDESDPDIVILRPSTARSWRPSAREGHEGGHRGGRQGGLREAGRGQRGPFGFSRRRRPNEERLTLEGPYSSEHVEEGFSEGRSESR
jgi:hypothetical protein